MKISELKKILEQIEEKHGDNEVIISVQDYFTPYGFNAKLFIDTDGGWGGISSNGTETRLMASLEAKEDYSTGRTKHAKITYRV